MKAFGGIATCAIAATFVTFAWGAEAPLMLETKMFVAELGNDTVGRGSCLRIT